MYTAASLFDHYLIEALIFLEHFDVPLNGWIWIWWDDVITMTLILIQWPKLEFICYKSMWCTGGTMVYVYTYIYMYMCLYIFLWAPNCIPKPLLLWLVWILSFYFRRLFGKKKSLIILKIDCDMMTLSKLIYWYVKIVAQLLSCVRLFATSGLQHTKLHSPLLSPGVCSNSCTWNQWWHSTALSSVAPFSSCPPSFPSSASFPMSQSAFRIRWTKYWSFSFSTSPSNQYSGLVSFRTDWIDLRAVQGAFKSFLQCHSSKGSILWMMSKWSHTKEMRSLPSKIIQLCHLLH